MKTILIAIDYDPTAKTVAEIGYNLGKDMNAKVILLHVVVNPAYYSSAIYSPIMGFGGYINTDFWDPEVVQTIRRETYVYLDKVREHLGGDNVETLVAEGDTADKIVETAINKSADVIVIGSHSRKWMEEILMGSVTHDVVKASNIPLFIIPTKHIIPS